MTSEQYFKKIVTPVCWGGQEYHLYISIDQKKQFVGNFLSGTGYFLYGKNFKAQSLNGLLEKIYIYRSRKI